MYRNGKKKMHFMLQLIIHLTKKLRGALDGARKVALSDLHKNVQEGAFEVAPKISL